MKNVNDILLRMSQILEENNSNLDWANKLKSAIEEGSLYPDDFRRNIRQMYGGMGSLNDIVIISSDGSIGKEANIEFDILREKLFTILDK